MWIISNFIYLFIIYLFIYLKIQVPWCIGQIVINVSNGVAFTLGSSGHHLLGLLDPEDEGTAICLNVTTYQSTRRNIPEDMNLQQHRWQNLKSHIYDLLNDLCISDFVSSNESRTGKSYVQLKGVPVHSMKAHGEVEVQVHSFVTAALHRGERAAPRPGGFIPVERARVTHWIGGWVGPRAGVDDFEYRKIPCFRRKLNRRSSVVQALAWSLNQLSYPSSMNWARRERKQSWPKLTY